MILHIFKKDFRRLWPFVLGLIGACLVYAIVQSTTAIGLEEGSGQDRQLTRMLLNILTVILVLLSFFLTVMLVQLDSLPDDRQDWLVRPIRRRDLLLAKLLFVLACILAPLLAGDVLEGLALGFPPAETFATGLSSNLYWLVILILPALAVAVLTRNLPELLGVGFAVLVGVFVTMFGLDIVQGPGTARDNGHSMTSFVLQMTVIVVGVAAILGSQYFRRATWRGRVILAVAAFLAAGAQGLPENMAYGLENWLSATPARTVSLSFAPEAGRGPDKAAMIDNFEFGGPAVPVLVPLRVTGLPPGTSLDIGGNARARMPGGGGEPVTFDVRGFPLDRAGSGDPGVLYLQLFVSREFFLTHADQPLPLDLHLILAVLKPAATEQMPAKDGHILIPGVGQCVSGVNGMGTQVRLNCLWSGAAHKKVTAALIDTAAGRRNPSQVLRGVADAPFQGGTGFNSRTGTGLPFRDMETGALYPVGPAQLPTAAVALSVAEPQAFLARDIAIPAIRLRDWAMDAPKGVSQFSGGK